MNCMRTWCRVAGGLLGMAAMLTFCTAALADATPAGLWRTFDPDTHQPRSLVRITTEGGVLRGVIEKLLDPAAANPVCEKCTDDRRGQPVIGMTILRDVRYSPDEPGLWEGGEILEPKTGKVYSVQLRLADGGKTLQVHGYLGSPMFGRTRTWARVEETR